MAQECKPVRGEAVCFYEDRVLDRCPSMCSPPKVPAGCQVTGYEWPICTYTVCCDAKPKEKSNTDGWSFPSLLKLFRQ